MQRLGFGEQVSTIVSDTIEKSQKYFFAVDGEILGFRANAQLPVITPNFNDRAEHRATLLYAVR